jgi:hypothetical protein
VVKHRLVALGLVTVAWTNAAFAFMHNESIHGDLSSVASSPTPLVLEVGANVLSGSTGGGDFDFLTFEVGALQQLDELILDAYGGFSLSFVGLQAGSVWTAGQGFGISAAALLGWTHFGQADVGTDILDDIAVGFGAQGFTRPLGPGHYSMLFQDTGGSVSYSVTFLATALVPDGDFDDNGLYECADVDALVAHIVDVGQGGTPDPTFDLTQDGLIDIMDLDAWRVEAGTILTTSGNPILEGDANLDGSVDGSDFGIWNSAKFTQVPAWCSGDFNADGAVDGSDFGVWNANKFQTADQATLVPEPTFCAALLLLLWRTMRARTQG